MGQWTVSGNLIRLSVLEALEIHKYHMTTETSTSFKRPLSYDQISCTERIMTISDIGTLPQAPPLADEGSLICQIKPIVSTCCQTQQIPTKCIIFFRRNTSV